LSNSALPNGFSVLRESSASQAIGRSLAAILTASAMFLLVSIYDANGKYYTHVVGSQVQFL
jgi:hypothetical protein